MTASGRRRPAPPESSFENDAGQQEAIAHMNAPVWPVNPVEATSRSMGEAPQAQQFFPQSLSQQVSGAPEIATPRRERLGDILKRARERRREPIEQISDYLRIRPSFLWALENSRYNDLPADAYAIGFIRSYAQYLGMNGKEAIDLYRQEMEGRRKKPQLTMPQPISEGRAPTAMLMAGAAFAAFLIYLMWYNSSEPEGSPVDPPLPVSASEKSQSQLQPQTPTSQVEATSSLPAPSLPTHSSILIPEQESAATSQPPTSSGPSVVAPASPPAAVVSPSVSVQATVPQQPQPTAATPSPSPAAENAPPVPDKAIVAPSGRVYGDTVRPRVVLRAEQESWVMVVDPDGNQLFSKVLRPGDSYRVPVDKELSLTAGNISGLVVNVDGTDIPTISSSSRIMRNLSLDPERLRSRSGR